MKSNLHFLEVRCFAERIDSSVWQAFCVDLDLAAQAESFEEVRRKLDSMIKEYVTDAVQGEDRQYCEQLLSRKSPLSLRARYHSIVVKTRVAHALRLAEDGIKDAIAFVERKRPAATPCRQPRSVISPQAASDAAARLRCHGPLWSAAL